MTLQTLFISDVVCRKRTGQKQSGRQLITFLLITNLTLWIVYTFVMQKLEASPIQLKVFGFTTWTLILRITLPLSIFYRFILLIHLLKYGKIHTKLPHHHQFHHHLQIEKNKDLKKKNSIQNPMRIEENE